MVRFLDNEYIDIYTNMNSSRTVLEKVINKGEEKNGSVEFKSQLNQDIHLADGRRESLAAQLKYRIMSGDGEATYVIGVSDDGDIVGLEPDKFKESIDVLSLLAREVDSHIDDVSTWETDENTGDNRIVGLVSVLNGSDSTNDTNNLIIGTAGHVDHGKSTLIGSLVTGEADDGEGGTRAYLDVQPHEVDRGLSADLSYAAYGFSDGETNHMDNPNRNSDRSQIVKESDKLISFVDTVGHEPWLRTTIRGLVGQRLDYGLIVVAADDGVTQTTREHLGLLIATDLPVIVALTKTDMVTDERIEEVEMSVEKLLRHVNRTPLSMERHDVNTAVNEIENSVAPIVRTSAVTLDGFDILNQLFKNLPKREQEKGDFKMYIDTIYNVSGIGPVVSGSIQSGEVEQGDELVIGPYPDGSYKKTKARSIEMHYHRIDKAQAGQMVSIAIRNVDLDDVKRGMVLQPNDAEPTATKEFEAEIVVLNHPTSITDGYEPVIHLETISETAVITPTEKNMLAGDKGRAKFKFKFNRYNIREGQRFIFREGSSKGVGTVKKIID